MSPAASTPLGDIPAGSVWHSSGSAPLFIGGSRSGELHHSLWPPKTEREKTYA